MKRFLAVIPARGGSKSIPRKNIIDLNGKPLMVWSIEASLNSKYISQTVVSSDDDEILSVAKQYGSEIIKRPVELAMDSSKAEPTLTHALKALDEEYDYLVLLQATSPFRTSKHLDEAIEKFLEDEVSALISVYEPSHTPLKAFVLDNKGHLQGIVNNEYPFMPRQSLPKTYYPNGAIYIVSVEKFLESEKLFYIDDTSFYEMSEEESVDIDSFSDLEKASTYN